MTDIVTRLRRWTISTDAVPASDLMDEAADEIERLRADLSRSGEIATKTRASCEKCPDGESVSKNNQMRHVSETCRQTTHDAVPAAIARTDAATGEPGGGQGTGKQPAPPCVETDASPSGSSNRLINGEAERQSPASDWREAQPLDDTRPDTNGKATGGRGHFLSEAEIDALEYVVVEGRIACHEDYGILRSLLVRLRPEWEASGDLGLRKEEGDK